MATAIYDVVHIVAPGTPGPIEPGRWLCVSLLSLRAATEIAAVYHRHSHEPGIAYTVERHDSDTCPGRAIQYRDWDGERQASTGPMTCTCKQEQE